MDESSGKALGAVRERKRETEPDRRKNGREKADAKRFFAAGYALIEVREDCRRARIQSRVCEEVKNMAFPAMPYFFAPKSKNCQNNA